MPPNDDDDDDDDENDVDVDIDEDRKMTMTKSMMAPKDFSPVRSRKKKEKNRTLIGDAETKGLKLDPPQPPPPGHPMCYTIYSVMYSNLLCDVMTPDCCTFVWIQNLISTTQNLTCKILR